MKFVALFVIVVVILTLTGTSRSRKSGSGAPTSTLRRANRRHASSLPSTRKHRSGNSTSTALVGGAVSSSSPPQRKSKSRGHRCRKSKRAGGKCGGKRSRKDGGKKSKHGKKNRKLSRHHRKLIMRRFHNNLEEFNNETDSTVVANRVTSQLPREMLVPPFFLNETLTIGTVGGVGGRGSAIISGAGNCTESSAAVPNFMVWLYDSKSLRDGNTVRSLYACAGDSHQRHEKGKPILITHDDVTMDVVFAFNASKIPTFEDLTKSELRLQISCKTKQQMMTSPSSATSHGGDVTQKATVAVYERVDGEQGVVYRNVTEIGLVKQNENSDERSVIGGDAPFLNYVIIARRDPRYLLIVRLVNDVTNNDVTTDRFRVINANHDRSKRRSSDVTNVTMTSSFPILVVYGHDARSVVPMSDPVGKLKLIHAESAPLGTPPPPNFATSSRTRRSAGDVIDANVTSEGRKGRGGGRRKSRGCGGKRRCPPGDDVDVTSSNDTSGLCGLKKFYVNFKKLGWSNWVVAPAGYEMSYCDGKCEVDSKVEMTNHAVIQWLVRRDDPSQVKPPCCVPNQLDRISILYLDSASQVVLKVYPEMVARSCSCR